MLSGKVALITGASGGIGRAVALRFASLGAKIVAADLNKEEGTETVMQIQKAGGVAMFFSCDVSKSSDIQRLFEEAKKHFGRIDIVCNNAGVARTDENFSTPGEYWRLMLDINLTSVLEGTKLAIQVMKEQEKIGDGPKGIVINTASLAAFFPPPDQAIYAVTKGAVAQLSRAMKPTENVTGVYVSAVCPGFIETKMTKSLPKAVLKATQGDFIEMDTVVNVFEDLALNKHGRGGSVVRITKQKGPEYEEKLVFVPAKL
eukprot:TRINITY_DN16038_c0_g1_i1.p1 TRINITY_DN16038_c0_g1~~TRINITY_DN16038_c0_g1_i1.p1  ORF type:complete len:259 (+),score=56.74 TRINITY_DN16038_c0_g1_i1:3-779(+)